MVQVADAREVSLLRVWSRWLKFFEHSHTLGLLVVFCLFDWFLIRVSEDWSFHSTVILLTKDELEENKQACFSEICCKSVENVRNVLLGTRED